MPMCRTALLFALSLALAATVAVGQTPSPAASTADDQIVDAAHIPPKTPAQLRDEAWTMLTQAATQKGVELHVQALAALGTMGANSRSLALIRTAMTDKEVDVRSAAVLAAGQTKSANLTSDLRRALDDKDPGVAFTAAITLWKMQDRSGEDILVAVADGDRKTAPGFVAGTEHNITRELRDPAGLARYGATQGAYMLLGPFGMGLTAYEYLHKNGGDASRVTALEAIAENHTAPIRQELIAALGDKDLGVRAAAAKALGRYREADVAPALAKVFDDTKPPVRLTAAAAYLVSTGVAPGSPVEGEGRTRGRAK